MTTDSQPPDSHARSPIATLGDLLYTDATKTRVAESEWVELIHFIATGDQFALRSLYERTHRFVFTLIVRMTRDSKTAEDLTVEVFHEIAHRASNYDAECGSVLGWVMNLARSRSFERPRSERSAPRSDSRAEGELTETLSADLWGRLARRLVEERSESFALRARPPRPDSEWEQVAPGISCKLLATDADRHRVSMLVRLGPGIAYPPHRHAGIEELHLLDGELWIEDQKLCPGDYNRAEPGTSDFRVWSETGCTCVLITSPLDELR